MTTLTPRPTRAIGRWTRVLGALAMGVASAALLGGCVEGPYASTEFERSPEAYKPMADSFAKVGYRWDWSGFPTPASGEGVVFLDAYADIVVTQDTGSKLVVIESASGRVRWSSELANRATKFVGSVRMTDAARGDHLIASSESEAFILDLRTGGMLSRQRLGEVVNTRPVLIGPVAWYGTPDGEMYGHVVTRNVKFNGYQMPGAIEQPLVLVGGALGAVSQAGQVAFIDSVSGSLLGRTKIYGGSAAELGAGDSLMFVASLDQSLYAFNTLGQTVWRKRTSRPLRDKPVFHDRTVYCTIAEQGFTAFDATTGQERWSNRNVSGAVIGVRNKRLVVWDGTAMSLIDPASGATVERVELPGLLRLTLDKFVDGNLYAVNRGGVVGKFVPR